ncbi:MAG: hypothetical protein MUF54_01780, partial [Polyangiaceae bacterium]|nr:hypothetical protein [Polyangiaceae bacterium]
QWAGSMSSVRFISSAHGMYDVQQRHVRVFGAGAWLVEMVESCASGPCSAGCVPNPPGVDLSGRKPEHKLATCADSIDHDCCGKTDELDTGCVAGGCSRCSRRGGYRRLGWHGGRCRT